MRTNDLSKPWWEAHGLATRHGLAHAFPLFETAPLGWAQDFAGRVLEAADALSKAVQEALALRTDPDLRSEVAFERAVARFEPAAAAVLAVAGNERGRIEAERIAVEEQRDAAIAGEPSGNAAEEVARQAALERTLGHLRSLEPKARAQFLLDHSAAGDPLPYRAATAPGQYAELVRPEVIAEARRHLADRAKPALAVQLAEVDAKALATASWALLLDRHVARRRNEAVGSVAPVAPAIAGTSPARVA